MRGSGLGQGKNGIIFDLDMSGEMHMRRREMRYSAAYPTGAERRKSGKRGLTCFAHIAICDVQRT